MAQLNFDARQVAPDTGFDLVPAGWYNVQADESDMKPTTKGDGAYLQVRFNILDGQYVGRKLFARFNIRNPSPVAQEIGQKQLSALAHAVGHLVIANSEELHGKPLKVKVKVRKDKGGEYDDQNEITTYKNINEQVDGAVAGAPAGFAPPGAPAAPQAPTAFVPPVQSQPAAPAIPVAPVVAQPAAPVVAHDPMAAARADGWQPHPQSPGYHWKGTEALPDAQVAAKYPAPAAAAPPAWSAPTAQQPWNAAPPAAAATPPAPPAGGPPATGTPPWAQQK
jgi:hypothetical protein